MKLIFLGPPGAGKGTQAERICRDFGVVQLSTGDILRANKKLGTDLGLKAQKYIDNGELVPDDIIIDMIEKELKKPEINAGYILDGFPRTIPQAEALDKLLDKMKEKLDHVLVLNVPEEELIKRLTARRVDKTTGKTYHLIFNPPPKEAEPNLIQRDDDKEETVKRRLKVYRDQTYPLIEYYKNKSKAEMIDGVGSLEDVYSRIRGVLNGKH
ncbi:MAG: adenylate kinase [Candidatus Kapaibacterium sp.]